MTFDDDDDDDDDDKGDAADDVAADDDDDADNDNDDDEDDGDAEKQDADHVDHENGMKQDHEKVTTLNLARQRLTCNFQNSLSLLRQTDVPSPSSRNQLLMFSTLPCTSVSLVSHCN